MLSTAMKAMKIGAISLAISAISLVGISEAVSIPASTILAPIKETVRTPVRVALDGDGNIFVTDPANRGVLRYNRFGKFQQVIPTPGTPQGVYCLSDGKLLVGQGSYVSILNPDGTEAGKLGSGVGQFALANGIAVDAAGFIYVVDTNENSVKAFTAAGQFSFQFGTKGIDNGQFTLPTAIAYEKQSNLLAVVDTVNGRVQFFDTLGRWVKTVGNLGSGPMAFTYPQGVGFDYGRDGASAPRMYVLDTFQSSIQVIDPAGAGTYLSFIGSYGTGNGQLVVPSDLVFDQINSRLIVVNGYGYLTIYGIDGGTSPIGDITPPTLSLDPVPAYISQEVLTITGSVEEGAAISASVNGAAVAITVNGTSWNAILTLAPGANSIKVAATDAVGNPASQSAVVSYVLAAPGLMVNPVAPVTNQANLVLAGTTDAGSTVTIAHNGQPAQAAEVSGTAWTYTLSLASGVNNIVVKSEKLFSAATTATITTVVDVVAPGLNVDSVPGTVFDSSFALTGATEAGAALTVALNGAAPQEVALSGASFNAALTLVPGANTIRVIVADAAGNSTVRNLSVTYTLPAPELTVNPISASINNEAQTLTGTVTEGATVSVALNGAAAQPAVVTGTTWSCALTGFTSGTNSLVITAVRPNSETATRSLLVKLDSEAPVLTLSVLSDGSYTSNPMLNISGIALDADAVTVSVNGTPIPAVNGSFSTAVNLLPGANIIAVSAIDAAGNLTADTRTIYYDNTMPVITITDPADNTFMKTSVVTLTGAVDTLAAVTVAGVPALMDGTNWTSTLSLEPGLNTVEVQATDLAGNVASAKRTITFDSMAPVLAITSPAQDVVTRQSTVVFSIAVADATGVTVTALVNGQEKPVTGADGAFSFNVDFATEGVYLVSVNAYDRAGNSSNAVRTIIYDATPPVLTIDPVTGVYPQRLTGTLEPGAIISATDKNGSVGIFTIAGGTWEADMGTVYDPDTMLITAIDAAGNLVSKTFTVYEPNGDLNGDGTVSMADAQLAYKMVVNNIKPTKDQLMRGDVGPLLNGKPNPDGKIDVTDVAIIQKKALANRNKK